MLKTPAIKDWVFQASQQLTAVDIPSAHLDAEIILAHVFEKDRTYLHAHPEQIISSDICNVANKLLKKRAQRVPLAYLFGYKEFYGRKFYVNKHTLIPRPESEDIINLLKDYKIHGKIKLVDVGIGSGCFGITAKLENPELDVTIMDISRKALKVAKDNVANLAAKVSIVQSNLLKNYADKPDIVIANLPYVDKSWDRSPETSYEPSLALFAIDNGLQLVKALLIQASDKMSQGGRIIMEADVAQHEEMVKFAKKQHFSILKIQGYAVIFEKIS